MIRSVIALGATAAIGAGAASAAPVTYTDLVYSGASERNVLDLHVADATGETPLLVFLHGGPGARATRRSSRARDCSAFSTQGSRLPP